MPAQTRHFCGRVAGVSALRPSRRCWTELLLSLGNLSIAKRLVGAKFHKEVSIVSVRKGSYSWPEIARMGLTE